MFGTSKLEAQEKQIKPGETTGTSGTSTSSGSWGEETPILENLPTGYTRITNWSYVEWYTVAGNVAGTLRNKRINVETELAVSSIHDGANSAFWIFKPIPDTDFYRIENMWKKGQVLYHTITPSTNALTADVLFGQVAIDDPRAQWKLENGPENRPNTFIIEAANPAYGHKLVVGDGKLKVSQEINNHYFWELSVRPNEVPPPIERDPLIPTELVRIEKGSMRINVETDLAISAIHDGAWSAMWTLVPIDGEPFYRIENKWKKNGQALNVTNHTLQFSAVSQDSHSAQWAIKRGTNEGEFYFKSRDGFTIYKSGSTINVYGSGHYPPKYSTTTWTLNKV